ncbi:putative cation channel sperm-associated protein subunit delta [Apostichopus japonicus]|uniref:Putative cation channel sperm-associated protein subunit delta n=1 Tax=Stichopus japonicus TaxID=307972 RepID=A0A2G8L742_STIJA|nr:putative cation channel sperm-associated protein subunit delta [Apostichopus japonicus]
MFILNALVSGRCFATDVRNISTPYVYISIINLFYSQCSPEWPMLCFATHVRTISSLYEYISIINISILNALVTEWKMLCNRCLYYQFTNYISCHSPEQGAERCDPSQPYEVLSNNTANGIKFSQYNGIYVFNITVLDPDYSFCQLETQFAVEVFGAFPKSELPALRIMMITCGLGLIALISLYVIDIFYWRNGEEERVETRRDSFPY